jgi:hypothetical protein
MSRLTRVLSSAIRDGPTPASFASRLGRSMASLDVTKEAGVEMNHLGVLRIEEVTG